MPNLSNIQEEIEAGIFIAIVGGTRKVYFFVHVIFLLWRNFYQKKRCIHKIANYLAVKNVYCGLNKKKKKTF